MAGLLMLHSLSGSSSRRPALHFNPPFVYKAAVRAWPGRPEVRSGGTRHPCTRNTACIARNSAAWQRPYYRPISPMLRASQGALQHCACFALLERNADGLEDPPHRAACGPQETLRTVKRKLMMGVQGASHCHAGCGIRNARAATVAGAGGWRALGTVGPTSPCSSLANPVDITQRRVAGRA